MKTIFKLLTLVTLITCFNCNNSSQIDYKYAEKPNLLACDLPDENLLKEAVYSFENDIVNTYDMQNRNIAKSYSNFINFKQRGRLNIKTIASEHSLNIAKILKEKTNLWVTENGTTSLNNSNTLINCIAKNIKDKSINTTYNALLSTNSFEPRLILPLLSGNSRHIQVDGALKTHVAMAFFYSELLDVNLEELTNPNPKTPVEPATPALNGIDLNKTPSKTAPVKTSTRPGHEGHNHD